MDSKWRKRMSRNSVCHACKHYVEEHATYEEGGYLEELECRKRPGIANLWSFPFIKAQKCFEEYLFPYECDEHGNLIEQPRPASKEGER